MIDNLLHHKEYVYIMGALALVSGIYCAVAAIRHKLDERELEREGDDDFGDECNGKCDHCKGDCLNSLFTTYYPTGNKFGKGGN